MTAKKTEKANFEAALRELEAAVEKLEKGDLPLEEAMACFERGVKSAAHCQSLLKDVESRVELLLKDRDGELHREPFDSD
jgi:exodeoxyribonuclease VII small subunit